MINYKKLIVAAEKLVDSVSFDMNGILMPNGFFGGNGGLISDDTMRASDELRRIIARARQECPARKETPHAND